MATMLKIKNNEILYEFRFKPGARISYDVILDRVKEDVNLNDYEEVDIESIQDETKLDLSAPIANYIEESDYVYDWFQNKMVKYRRDENWFEKLVRCGWSAFGIDLSTTYGQVSEGVSVATTQVPLFSRDKNRITLAESLVMKSDYIGETIKSLGAATGSEFKVLENAKVLKFAGVAKRSAVLFARCLPGVELVLTTYDVYTFGSCLWGKAEKVYIPNAVPSPPIDIRPLFEIK